MLCLALSGGSMWVSPVPTAESLALKKLLRCSPCTILPSTSPCLPSSPHLDSQGIGGMVTKALFSLDSVGPLISLPSKSLTARALTTALPASGACRGHSGDPETSPAGPLQLQAGEESPAE